MHQYHFLVTHKGVHGKDRGCQKEGYARPLSRNPKIHGNPKRVDARSANEMRLAIVRQFYRNVAASLVVISGLCYGYLIIGL